MLGANAFTGIPLRANPAEDLGIEISQEIINEALRNPAYPNNIVNANNWNETEVKGDDYWPLGDLKPVKVGESDPVDMTDINYQGYFVDAEGRTNLRLVYMEASTVVSAVWKNLVIRVDSDLYNKIDWEKSYIVSTDGKDTVKFSQGTGSNEKQVNIYDLAKRSTSKKTNLPINLVLNDGLDITSLGNKNYVIQSRLTGSKNRLFAYAPGKTPLDYSSYTRQTSISLKDNITSEFLRGPGQSGTLIAQQNQFMTEFIANPDKFDDTSEIAVLRTMYGGLADLNASINTVDGKALKKKPIAYMQVFDARLIDYFKADANGVIADTTILEENKDPSKDAKSIPIKMENINYTADGKLAYIVIGESNFSKEGVKVVTVNSLYDYVYDKVWYFTTIDYRIDKKKLSETFETSGKNKEIFSSMSGFVDSNPNGWSIFENSYDGDKNFVVQEGESYIVDVSGISKKDQQGLMIQVGDTTQSLVRAMQGYYNTSKGGFDGIEKANEIAAGIYEFTLREGATIKPGESIRIYLPDNGDAQAPVNFMEMFNATKRNEGAATLKLESDRNIYFHIYNKDKATFKLIYTPKGKQETAEINFTRNRINTFWQNDDKNKVLKYAGATDTGLIGGNYKIDTTKLEPGADIYIEAYDTTGKKIDGLTSHFKYRPLAKSNDKYTKMAWVDHQDNSSIISMEKSLFVPYQEVYTNDYTDYGKDELYYNEKVDNNHYKNPTDNTVTNEEFMNNTEELLGFTKYQGGNIRMRYYQPDGKVYVGKATADASEYNDDGEVTKDAEKAVNIGGTEYKAYPYKMSLSTLSELRDAGTVEGGKLQLLKDMKLLLNASDGSSLPSKWYETRVKTRVLFDATEGTLEGGNKKAVKIVPDNEKYYQDEGYTANGFTGANVKENTGDEFAKNPTADGKTFLGWVTEEGKTELVNTIVKAEAFDKLDAAKKFTAETPVTTHQVVYAIWLEETLITFDANGGKFADDSTTKTDDLTDGVTAPAEPTQDGKTFAGWAKTPDATEADVIDVTTLTEATTVYAVWKDGATEKTADKVEPAYTDADAQAGKPTTISAPNFTDKDGKDTTKPEGTTFELGADAPAGATIDPATGEIKYTPAEDKAGQNVEIPVVVNYKDGSKDEVKATVTVAAPTADTEAPGKPTVDAKDNGDVEVTPPTDADTKEVEVTYVPEGQKDPVTVTATKGADGTWSVPQGSDVTVDPQTGKITVPADKVADGTEVKAVAKDEAGNASDPATATAKTPTENKTAKPTIDEITISSTEIKGTAPAGSTVTVTVPDNKQLTATADANGDWSVAIPKGTTLEAAQSVSAHAQETGKEPSDEVYQTVSQALEPQEKSTKPTINPVKVGDTKITGKAEPNAIVNVTYPNGDVTETTADGQGNWSVDAPEGMTEGQTISATATEDGKAPSDPEKAKVGNNTPQVDDVILDVNDLFFDDMLTSGYTLPYLDVTVRFPDGTIENTTSDARGYWNVPTPRNLRKGHVVYVTVYDGGKIVASRAVIVKDGYRYNDDDYYYRRHRRDDDRRRNDDIRDTEEKDEEIVVTEKHKAYMFGYQDGTVRPNASVTRAEAAAMVARLMGYNLGNYQKPAFKDTDGWYNNVINAVVSNGLMKGYSDGSFKPNKKITRAEFAELIKNIDKVNFASVPFSDVKGHWAEQAIAQAYANGRISGYNDGTFKPNAKITRAEAARILNSVFNRKVDQLGYNQAHGLMKFFTDLNASEWYYNDIIEATNTHEFIRKTDGLMEDWKEVK